MRKGCFASVPRRYTVSMCASSRIFFVPLPSKRACTTLPILAGVSSMRYAPSLVSTSSTLPPSAERRAAISLAARSSPSRSLLPVSIETSSLSVSRSGWRSFFASASTGSTGCAAARPGRALARKAVQRVRTRALTVSSSGGARDGHSIRSRGGMLRSTPYAHTRPRSRPEADGSPHRVRVRGRRNHPLPDAHARRLRRRVPRGRSRSGLGGDADLRRFSRRHLPDRAARRPLRQAPPHPDRARRADRRSARDGGRADATGTHRRELRRRRHLGLRPGRHPADRGARPAGEARARDGRAARLPVSRNTLRLPLGRADRPVFRLALDVRQRGGDAAPARPRPGPVASFDALEDPTRLLAPDRLALRI